MTAPPNKGQGRGIALIRQYASYRGDDCIVWPMSRNPNGYGTLGFEGTRYWAHRLMCQLAHGDPPTPQHQAAHNCGNGHKGCFNPRHLSWKTPQENTLDMRVHGTMPRKPGCIRFKLTPEIAEKIRSLKGLYTQVELAKMYGVTWQNIGHILRGETWAKDLWPERTRIVTALKAAKRPLKIREISVAADLPNEYSASNLLKVLVRIGKVERVARGIYQAAVTEGTHE